MVSDLKADLVMMAFQRRPTVYLMDNPAVGYVPEEGSSDLVKIGYLAIENTGFGRFFLTKLELQKLPMYYR